MKQEKTMEQQKMKKQIAHGIFWTLFIVYILLNCTLIYFCLTTEPVRPWLTKSFMAGLILGGLFVLIAMYHFHSIYLTPYLEEEIKSEKEERGRRTNIYVFFAMWSIPPLIVQCCVILGFVGTVTLSPLKGNIYFQPYRYGQIYKKVENFNTTELGRGVFAKDELPKILERKKMLLDTVSVYLKADSIKRWGAEAIVYYIPLLIALAFSFLGVLVYTLKDASFRLHTEDLYPRTYVGYLIRFLMALTISITIGYFLPYGT